MRAAPPRPANHLPSAAAGGQLCAGKHGLYHRFFENVATGLRVGTVVCPSRYRPEIERAIRATTWNTPSLVSSLICAWIEDGTVARFEAQKRQDARRRQGLPARFSARFPSSAIRIRILSGCLWARRVGPIGWRKR
jgi:hypothetical protein